MVKCKVIFKLRQEEHIYRRGRRSHLEKLALGQKAVTFKLGNWLAGETRIKRMVKWRNTIESTCILRKSGFLCSPLDMLMGMSWNSTSFSRRQANTLETAVDNVGPYTFTGAAIWIGNEASQIGNALVILSSGFSFRCIPCVYLFCFQPQKGKHIRLPLYQALSLAWDSSSRWSPLPK